MPCDGAEVSNHGPGAPRTTWSRSQRFRLSTAGREAGNTYLEVIVAARGASARKSFDAARAEWAARLGLELNDGLCLGELLEGPKTIAEIAASLEGCGPTPGEVRKAVERLVRLDMIELVTPPAPAPPSGRW